MKSTSLFTLRSFLRTFTRLFVQKLVSRVLYLILLCHCLPKHLSLPLRQNFSCFGCFPGMTSSLAKCKQDIGRVLLDVFYNNLLICVIFFNMQYYAILYEKRRQSIYFSIQKNRCISPLRHGTQRWPSRCVKSWNYGCTLAF